MSSVKMQVHANVKRRHFPLTFLPLPLSLSVYYPDVPTRTALELPTTKDISSDGGAAMPAAAAEAVSADPVQAVVVPATMKNRPLPDIPKEAVSQLNRPNPTSDNATVQAEILNAVASVAVGGSL